MNNQSEIWQHVKSGGLYTIITDDATIMTDWVPKNAAPVHEGALMEADLTTVTAYMTHGGTWMVLAQNDDLEWVGRPCTVYMSLFDGQVWIRPHTEFHDGRFINLSVDEVRDCRPEAERNEAALAATTHTMNVARRIVREVVHGSRHVTLGDKVLAKMDAAEKGHCVHYTPSLMAMGDCATCGKTQETHP
ncbi:hypothetical protein [uncultured Pelagimonas sp.]|uniref:hypothetical protein n=1 Tax=uncultured Pelagimonas sp. TaxID=1618102 RepID=UPI002623842D|nr:hypothetical protein [uncultured Pelagimonas sp.]